MNKIWSEWEKQYVKDNAGKMKDQAIADELTKRSGRLVSLQAVRKQRQKLGINKKPGRGICSLVQTEIPPVNRQVDIDEASSSGVQANVAS